MGHIRLGTLPATRDWNAVVNLLDSGAGAASVAGATAHAARAGFAIAKQDSGLIAALHLLMQLPLAARSPDFAAALRALGVDAERSPSLLELNGAVVDALDARIALARRTDVSEMAELAMVETVTDVVGAKLPQLFSPAPDDLRAALASFGTRKEFGFLARAFFGRFVERYFAYYLSRELSAHVGRGSRFRSIAEHTEFNEALRLHCFEAARIIEEFSGDWLSKTKWERGEVAESDTRRFLQVAMRKLDAELARREELRGA